MYCAYMYLEEMITYTICYRFTCINPSSMIKSPIYVKRKEGQTNWKSACCNCLRNTCHAFRSILVIIGAMICIVYVSVRVGGGSMQERRVKVLEGWHSSINRGGGDIIRLDLDSVQASTCAHHASLLNFTTPEYQVLVTFKLFELDFECCLAYVFILSCGIWNL